MGNPLFGNGGMGGQMGNNAFGPFGNLTNFMTQFNQFRAGFSGDPQQMVQQLRQSGQMTEDQFKQLSGMANQIMPFMRR